MEAARERVEAARLEVEAARLEDEAAILEAATDEGLMDRVGSARSRAGPEVELRGDQGR